MDPKLAKGHVRSEMRLLSRHAEFPCRVGVAVDFLKVLGKSKSVSPDIIVRAGRTVEKAFADNPSTVHLSRRSKGRFSRAKVEESVRAVCVKSEGENGGMSVECFDYHFTAYKYHCLTGNLPIEIARHACERLLERKGADEKAVRTLAAEVVKLAGLASFFMVPGRELPQRSLALPLRGGLLLCAIEEKFRGRDPIDAFPYVTNVIERLPDGNIDVDVGSTTQPAFFTHMPTKKMVVLHARTWVSRNQLFKDQLHLVEKLEDFAKRHEKACELLATAAMFPTGLAIQDIDGHEETMDGLCAPYDEAIDLLMSPHIARAMGNVGAPLDRPLDLLSTQYARRRADASRLSLYNAIGQVRPGAP